MSIPCFPESKRTLKSNPLAIISHCGKGLPDHTHDRSIAKEADVRLEMEDGRIRSTGNSVAPTRSLTLMRKKRDKKK